ncbi:MAG: ABC transporter ATP-binding protein [Brachymonas sp.]
MALLEIENLSVAFGSGKGWFHAVEGVSLSVDQGEVLGVVGESGSGKSVTMMAVMGLHDGQARITADTLSFNGQPLLQLSPRQRRQIIGKDIAMIFQDPMTSLNPSYTVGYQVMEVLKVHQGLRGAALQRRALELMELVEIPAAATRLSAYPHQLSGGMSQRVMIAMALACTPKLLIADEPTTALDVTIQAQIMDLLLRLQKEQGMALVLITHDLAVVSEVAQRVAVMYAGEIVEQSRVPVIFERPQHPYTHALLQAIPDFAEAGSRLVSLPGIVPGQYDRPVGCLLAPRCPIAFDRCHVERPAFTGTQTCGVRCFTPLNQEGGA